MAKINITKPNGSVDSLNLISAFNDNGQTYVILDSDKKGSMGLPIIYVCKYTNKLESINDENEWTSVKNSLRGIINGIQVQYVKINENVTGDEVYFKQLTLPEASFELIKSKYVVSDTISVSETPVLEPVSSPIEALTSEDSVLNNSVPVVETANPVEVAPIETQVVPTIAPVIPDNNVPSNTEVASAPVIPAIEPIVPVAPTPEEQNVNDNIPTVPANNVLPEAEIVPVQSEAVVEENIKIEDNIFLTDKETFLKACENMFDALVAKYTREVNKLNEREQIISQKEKEIETKLANANEHLKNAEAREQVANIAHDNAQKVMDLSSVIPNNINN